MNTKKDKERWIAAVSNNSVNRLGLFNAKSILPEEQ